MCHTELALKKKCNSPDWRHVKSFQIYLQDSLTSISSHQCQAAGRAPWWLRCCNSEGLWWLSILNFWWKIGFPALVALKTFSQIQTKTTITPEFRPLQRGWWCHGLSLVFVAMNGEEQWPFFWLTKDLLSEEEKDHSLSVFFSFPWLWRKARWAGFNFFLKTFSSGDSSIPIYCFLFSSKLHVIVLKVPFSWKAHADITELSICIFCFFFFFPKFASCSVEL